MTADIDGSINAIFMTGDLVSLLKVIQSDEDGEASWSSMTITHLVIIIIILFHFFFSDFHQTSQVGSLGGPLYTDPVSVTLTYFSRSQTHFSAKIKKLKIVITLLFLARFWSNFTGLYSRSTPSLWPSLVDLDLHLQVKLDIGSKFCYFYYYIFFPFFIRFPPNFTGRDPRGTLLHWPSFSDLDLLLKVRDPF